MTSTVTLSHNTYAAGGSGLYNVSCDVVTQEKRPFLHETRYFVNFQAITISYHVAVLAFGFLHTHVHTWSRDSLGYLQYMFIVHCTFSTGYFKAVYRYQARTIILS